METRESRAVEIPSKPKVFSLGRGVEVEIWGGLNTIGGNCIKVRDRDKALILDQGVNFSVFSKYYGGFIQPEVVEDLREVGAIPPRAVYESASELYISHLHLDHLGSLNIPIDYDIEIRVPSRQVLEKLSSFWHWNWKALLLPEDFSSLNLKDVSDSEKVRSILVSHSAYPSYSFLIETSEGTILYTGDLRERSPVGVIDTIENFQKELEGREVDMLIIEGTNFSRRITPLDAEDVERILTRILNKYDQKYIFVSAHPLDIESFLLVSKILENKGYELLLTHAKYAELLDVQLRQLGARGLENKPRFLLEPLKGSLSGPLNHIERVKLEDIKDRKVAFFTTLASISEMKMLRNRGINLRGLLHITLTGEPVDEEGRIMETRLGSWLIRFGMNSVRLHMSGHYYPYIFKDMLRTIKPRQLIPIHTKAPETMLALYNKQKERSS